MSEQKKAKPIVVTLPPNALDQSSNMENFKLVFDANNEIRQSLLKRAIKGKGKSSEKLELIAKFFATNINLDFTDNCNLYSFELKDSLGEQEFAMSPVYVGKYFLKSSRFATAENKQWYRQIKETLPVELSPNIYLTEHGKSLSIAQEISYFASMFGIENEIHKCGKKRLFNKETESYESLELYTNLVKIKTEDGFKVLTIDVTTTITELDALKCRTRDKIMAGLITDNNA